MAKKVIVIGAGFGGLASAALLAKDGFDVTVLEKNNMPGGRAQIFEEKGFRYDMGPSWYLMPEVFDYFFMQLGRERSDYYNIIKLDPSYKVIFEDGSEFIARSDLNYMAEEFEKLEKGAGAEFKNYIKKTKEKYEFGVPEYLLKENRSFTELIELNAIKNLDKFQLFDSYHSSVKKHFKNQRIQQILEFMSVFLGGSPFKIPALYNLINWADYGLGVYYPENGFFTVAKAFEKVALEEGAHINYLSEVTEIKVTGGKISSVCTIDNEFDTDIVVCNADYAYFDMNIIPKEYQEYSSEKWYDANLAPSALCFYLGVRGNIDKLLHHTLFLNNNWQESFKDLVNYRIPIRPQFYVSTPSKTDATVAPKGFENVFILVPTAPGVKDSVAIRKEIFAYIAGQVKKIVGIDLNSKVVFKRSYWINDFKKDYNAFKGNAFGLGHTLKHSLFMRPKNKSTKLSNLLYTGHYTNPGTGTPLVTMSGILIRDLVRKYYDKK